jgi:serpin B
MKKRIALVILLPLLFLYGGCSSKKDKLPFLGITYECKYDNKDNVDADLISVADSNNAFAADLYGQLQPQAGNLFYSPASIFTALSMTYAGAEGDTATEMYDVLNYTLTDLELHLNIGKLVEVLTTERANTTLSIANALWGQQDYSFLTVFLDLLAEYYNAPMNEVDFMTAPETARLTINAWVEAETNGKILDLLQPGTIDVLTRLVLTNAIYFKSNWKYPFDAAETVAQDFSLAGGGTVSSDMMVMDKDYMLEHDDLRFNVYNGTGFSMLELPYDREIFSMIFILPDTADGIASLESSLTATSLATWLSGMVPGELYEIRIPKFEFTSEFPLSSELAALGMPTAFDEALADFSGINGGIEQLYITDVVHKAYVKVNEEGTEAAAATAVIIGTTSMPPSFIVDHPFLFLIRHNATGTILFMGRVLDPTQ